MNYCNICFVRNYAPRNNETSTKLQLRKFWHQNSIHTFFRFFSWIIIKYFYIFKLFLSLFFNVTCHTIHFIIWLLLVNWIFVAVLFIIIIIISVITLCSFSVQVFFHVQHIEVIVTNFWDAFLDSFIFLTSVFWSKCFRNLQLKLLKKKPR